MHRSDHDPTADEGTHFLNDGGTVDAQGEEPSPRTERMHEPQPPRWDSTVPILGDSSLKDVVRHAGEALARQPAETTAVGPPGPNRHRRAEPGHTQVSAGQVRRLEPEPPTMRRPARRRWGPYFAGAAVCVVAGGVVAALWPSEGTPPPHLEVPPATTRPTTPVPPSPRPVASSAEPAPPSPASTLPLVEGASTGDGSNLAPYQGYLVVRSPLRADVFEGQTSRGPTNRKLVLRCRDYTFRLRDPHTQRWLSPPQPVHVACQKITTVVVPAPPR